MKPLLDQVHDLDVPEDGRVCTICQASLAEMTSDLVAVDGLRSNVLLRVQELTAPEETVERVRVSDVAGIGQTLSTPEEVDDLLEQLRDHLLKLIAAGIKGGIGVALDRVGSYAR